MYTEDIPGFKERGVSLSFNPPKSNTSNRTRRLSDTPLRSDDSDDPFFSMLKKSQDISSSPAPTRNTNTPSPPIFTPSIKNPWVATPSTSSNSTTTPSFRPNSVPSVQKKFIEHSDFIKDRDPSEIPRKFILMDTCQRNISYIKPWMLPPTMDLKTPISPSPNQKIFTGWRTLDPYTCQVYSSYFHLVNGHQTGYMSDQMAPKLFTKFVIFY